MSNWIATNELRIIQRPFKWISSEGDYEERTHPVIQQKWKHNEASYYGGRIVSEEWRDVPVVEEE